MRHADQSAEALRWIAAHSGKYVDVVMAGQVVGGRYGESPQCICSASIGEAAFRVQFAPSEILSVENPVGFECLPNGLFIRQATKLVFGWHYYGRPKTLENWCEQHYEFENGKVSFYAKGPLLSRAGFSLRSRRPARKAAQAPQLER